jgi:hypothetical protein
VGGDRIDLGAYSFSVAGVAMEEAYRATSLGMGFRQGVIISSDAHEL